MGWSPQDRSIPNWSVTVDTIKECLEGVLLGIEIGQEHGARIDVIALEALDEIDQMMVGLKRDLGA